MTKERRPSERMMRDYVRREDRISTHWEDCWRDPKHHACAVRKIEELEDAGEPVGLAQEVAAEIASTRRWRSEQNPAALTQEDLVTAFLRGWHAGRPSAGEEGEMSALQRADLVLTHARLDAHRAENERLRGVLDDLASYTHMSADDLREIARDAIKEKVVKVGIVDSPRQRAIDAAVRSMQAASPREKVEALASALEWYGEQARLARLVHSEGDAGRHALAADGGKRARAALNAIKEGANEIK